jgi:virulence-associated protein VapD
MFAISFDMVIIDLKNNYGEPYNNAYFEINKALRKYEFYNTQGSVYLSKNISICLIYFVQ